MQFSRVRDREVWVPLRRYSF